ncbi:chaperonin HslO-like protein [SAR86 cluster bacterium SAR86E]|uniref:ABC-type dipeptide transporter n=1 Tax=SAR86 cluster bacterium SAR86E TaxID=1208365 RepID=K6G652_9GAMM|nr:chaperonin HslO-like protein [SAR86 cluster bacterium SAR86E]
MDFSVAVQPGEAVGLVGESGCGKSTVALGVMQDLGVNGKVVNGSIKFKGQDLAKLSPEVLRDIRGNEIAMIYQEPMASLNPAMKIANQLMEVPMIHEGISKDEAYKRALEVVNDVKLPDPERILKSFPHQLSGGQQQRIVIAMALMSKPSLLILDEPQNVEFGCTCSEERVRQSLSIYSAKDIEKMTTPEGTVTADCQFCGAHYNLSPETVGFQASENGQS